MHFAGHKTILLLSFSLQATTGPQCASASGTPLPTTELLADSAAAGSSALRDVEWRMSPPGTHNNIAHSNLPPNHDSRQIPCTSRQVNGPRNVATKIPGLELLESPNMEPGYKAFMKSVQTLEHQSKHFRNELAGFHAEITEKSRMIIQQPSSGYRTKAMAIHCKLLEHVEELQAIHSLIPISARDRLFKLIDKRVVLKPSGAARNRGVGSMAKVGGNGHTEIKHFSSSVTPPEPRSNTATHNIEEPDDAGARAGLSDGNRGGANPSIRRASWTGPLGRKSMKIPLQPGELRGDVLDVVMDMVTWEWLERLNALLHKIMPLQTALKLIRVNTLDSIFTHVDLFEHLLLQQCVFRTVELTYIHRLIPLGHLQRFLNIQDTLRLASINVYESWKVFRYLAGRRQIYFHGFHYSKKFVELVDQGIEQMVPKVVIDKTRHSFSPFY